MDCVILVRVSSRRIIALSDDDGEIAVFPHLDAAMKAIDDYSVCQKMRYQIVECDEL